MTVSPGQTYLCPIPFFERNSSKVRPAVVISVCSANAHGDVVVLPIYTNRHVNSVLAKSTPHNGLKHDSFVRGAPFTISSGRFARHLGHIDSASMRRIMDMLYGLLAPGTPSQPEQTPTLDVEPPSPQVDS
jgi:mRNA-degrading endonuclease toxin of MazEF toxin-antitoxin module